MVTHITVDDVGVPGDSYCLTEFALYELPKLVPTDVPSKSIWWSVSIWCFTTADFVTDVWLDECLLNDLFYQYRVLHKNKVYYEERGVVEIIWIKLWRQF